MLTLIFRTIILYVIIIALVRFMGKRTIAELQVSELVITLLISDIAAVPMQETGTPLLAGIIPITVLASLEVIMSYVLLKSSRLSSVINGSALIIIQNGQPDKRVMSSLRITCSDLMESLRKCGVFDINDVKLAIVETDGSMSILKKGEGSFDTLVVSDGELSSDEVGFSENDGKNAVKELERCGVKIEEVFMLVRDERNRYTLIKK